MTEENLRKGPWYEEEDEQLKAFVAVLGAKRWDSVARISGLKRSGKSCRLRWLNYLRPSLKHGAITPQEEQIILKLHERWGNKWAKIARRLPGRTDNEVKNYWRTHQRKKEHTQYPLLHYSTSSPSTNISWGETSCSSNDHTSKKGEIPSTTPEISSNDNDDDNDNDNDNKKIMFLDETNYGIGAMISDDYDNNGDNQKGLLSDCMIMNSPYENRLSDWMNMLSKEIGDKCSPSVEEQFCLDDPMTWCFLGDCISAWDFIDTNKWDLDLFSVNN